jgi:chromosome segregation ATPase
MEIILREIVNNLEEITHTYRMDLDRITRELARLENLREDRFETLSREGNDEFLQKRLEETDDQIMSLKKKRNEVQSEADRKIKEARINAEKYRDDKIDKLKSIFKKHAEERDALRDEVLPELELELHDLQEKKKTLDGQLLTLTSEINELRRFDIQVPGPE